jgi:hypothetical protein
MRRTMAVAAGVAALLTGGAKAQEAMFTEAATMPSPGTYVLRQSFHYEKFGTAPDGGVTSTEKYESMTSLQYGLARSLSLMVRCRRW